jgi:riboflavin synthase
MAWKKLFFKRVSSKRGEGAREKGPKSVFTGIVDEVGTVIDVHQKGEVIQLRIKTSSTCRAGRPGDEDRSGGRLEDKIADMPGDRTAGRSGDRIGDSICINGVCLTVVSLADRLLKFDLSRETAGTTTLGDLRAQDRVNMERALRLSDRLSGHFLSGHVDGIGYIRKLQRSGQHYLLGVEAPESVSCYMVEKGSIALDGISLTIASLEKNLVWVSIIPHTAEVTSLKEKKTGDKVNVEADLLAKYIYRILTSHPLPQSLSSKECPSPCPLPSGKKGSVEGPCKESSLGREFLAKHGFLS